MATDFPPFVAYNHEDYDVHAVVVGAANAGKAGTLCVFNTGTNQLDECGADPALILGLMTGPYTARTIYPGSKMPVINLSDNVVVGMCSATTPADAHLQRLYGITKLASGNWSVDTTKAAGTEAVPGTARVKVVKVDISAGIFYCKYLAQFLQGDAVFS